MGGNSRISGQPDDRPGDLGRAPGRPTGITRVASAYPSSRTLASVPDGFCLDAEASTSGQNGQTAQHFGCAGNSNQAWTWAP